jgi:large subunit ribosomal protein L33
VSSGKKRNKNLLVRLVSTAGTGFFFVKKRNPKTLTEKLSFNKYDPVVRKHVLFTEQKIK